MTGKELVEELTVRAREEYDGGSSKRLAHLSGAIAALIDAGKLLYDDAYYADHPEGCVAMSTALARCEEEMKR